MDNFIFPANIMILDEEEEKDVPIIMGQPILAIERNLTDCDAGELIMRVNNKQVVFNIIMAVEYLETTDDYFVVNIIEQTATESWKEANS